MKKEPWLAVAVLILVAAGGAAIWWWQRQPSPTAPAPAEAPPSQPVVTSPPPPPVAQAASGIQHPIEAPEAASGRTDPESVLVDLFGQRSALSMFNVDDFPRRFAATVDNLGRASAPAIVWPVKPPAGKFLVEQRGDSEVISADNSLRYTPFVLLLESVDMERAVDAYRKLYPLFQHSYEDLGYPRGYFNDRVVEVIDLMLATPSLDSLPAVHLATVNGPVRPERPWVTYQFDDPALESLAAGQKILLRMGPVNERRIKAKLAQIRALLVKPKAGR